MPRARIYAPQEFESGLRANGTTGRMFLSFVVCTNQYPRFCQPAKSGVPSLRHFWRHIRTRQFDSPICTQADLQLRARVPARMAGQRVLYCAYVGGNGRAPNDDIWRSILPFAICHWRKTHLYLSSCRTMQDLIGFLLKHVPPGLQSVYYTK